MAPLEASIVFGIELGENVTVTLASANLLMLGAVSSPKIIFLFYFYNMAARVASALRASADTITHAGGAPPAATRAIKRAGPLERGLPPPRR